MQCELCMVVWIPMNWWSISNECVTSTKSICGQTHKITNQTSFAQTTQNFCYEYKNSTLLEEMNVHYVAIIMDVNAIEVIYLNVHPSLIINLYLTFNLVSIHS
jgi:hypothetical protein